MEGIWSMSETRTISDNQIRNIVESLNNIQDNYSISTYEDKIIPAVIQYMESQYIGLENAGYILSQTCNVTDHEDTLNGVYEHTIPPIPYGTIFQSELSPKDKSELEKAIEPRKQKGIIKYQIDNKNEYHVNFGTKSVNYVNITKDGEYQPTLVLDCVPKSVIVYDTILLDQPRSFKVTWETRLSPKPFTTQGETGGATIKEMEEYILNTGYFANPRRVGAAISAAMNAFVLNDMAIIQKDIDNEGFYWDSDKGIITPIKKEIREPTVEELTEAADILEELVKHFQGNEDVLASVIKWGLLSGFSYAKKQMGKWMPWLYLKGSAGSGKTTLAKIVLYLWGEPDSENSIGGGGFDTQARVGAKLSRDCNPLVVNEPAGAFNRQSVVELIKVSVESLFCRGKMFGGSYKQIPAFAPVIFTANQYLPEDDALLRRFYVLSFSYSMRKTDSEKKAFERAFHIDSPAVSPLRKLQSLKDFVVWEMLMTPDLLMEDWQETMDNILRKLYSDIGQSVPDWLKQWAESESLDDFDNSSIEDIRLFFIEAFNQAKRKVELRDENGYITSHQIDETASDSSDFEDMNWQIVNSRLLPWAMPKVSQHGTKYICLTQGLRKALSEKTEYCNDLKSIGELLGWKYTSVKFGGKVSKMLKVNFNEFLDFMYPNLRFDDEMEAGE